MSGAVRSRLDASVLRLMGARRFARGGVTEEKLALLRRLYRQYVACDVPRYTETRVEQSFNEQLFARMFEYQTLYSHDAAPFHLHAKDAMGGRYNDFSLGMFSAGEHVVIASAELKGPGWNLDAPQRDRDPPETPVEQAIDAARKGAARWAIVCNCQELRLYDVREPAEPVVVADLHEIRNRADLALLLAHFDRRALLPGNSSEAEMSTALDPTHPQQPVAAADRCYRIVFRYAPLVEQTVPLFLLEKALKDAIRGAAEANRYFGKNAWDDSIRMPRFELRDGWISVEEEVGETRTRLAMSTFGELQLSVRRKPEPPDRRVTPYDLWPVAQFFRQLTNRACASLNWDGKRGEGRAGAELREVKGACLNAGGVHAASLGYCATSDVSAGEFNFVPLMPPSEKALADVRGVAMCVCELAIHFRQQNDGAGVALDLADIEAKIRQ